MRKMIVAAFVGLVAAPLGAHAQDLPPGPGSDVTTRVCTSCHGTGEISSERHDAAGWATIVTQMVAQGASATDAEQAEIVQYLAATYSRSGAAPAPAAAAAPAAPVAAAPAPPPVAPAPAAPAAAPISTQDTKWDPVAKALGKSGSLMPGGIYRVGLPRTDLNVTLDGITLKPTFALGSWVAFMPMGARVMAMGDLVLTEDEVGPVMKKLEQENIDISALHNHLFHASPATFYMHIFAEGDGVTIARALHNALDLSKTPFTAAASGSAAPQTIDLDTAAVDSALSAKGSIAGGVYQVAIARAKPVTEHGMVLNPAIGASEAINFQPLGGGKAAITGDFMLTENEVNPVLRTLRENGIEVTALHGHMLTEEPRMFFMHFWAHDDLTKLLTGLHAALEKVAVKK